MSKGDNPRPYNKTKWDENFENIFGKKNVPTQPPTICGPNGCTYAGVIPSNSPVIHEEKGLIQYAGTGEFPEGKECSPSKPELPPFVRPTSTLPSETPSSTSSKSGAD